MDLPHSGCSASIRRRTEYPPRPPRSASEIAIRDRSNTRCNWGQKWGHNSSFSRYKYRARAMSKCFLGIRIACNGEFSGALNNHILPAIGRRQRPVFVSQVYPGPPINPTSMLKSFQRIWPEYDITAHGFRATYRTSTSTSICIDPSFHQMPGALGAVYARKS